MAGKRFPEDFDRIDKIKTTDKLLINDSKDGVDKYVTASQFYALLQEQFKNSVEETIEGFTDDVLGSVPVAMGEGESSTVVKNSWGPNKAGKNAFAEGYSTEATGEQSHTEGYETLASGKDSHAEGHCTSATNHSAHSEGTDTVASGWASHAEGMNTKATNHNGEHAEGKYNKSNTGTIHSVGIGTYDSNRKNAHEITEDGKHYILGIGGYDGTNPDKATDVATELTELSLQVGKLEEQVPSVFEAVYGKTTYAEIVEAISAGKTVICKYNNAQIGYLVSYSSNNAVFYSYSGVMTWVFACYSNDSWIFSTSDTRHELKTLDNGNAQITIAGKSAEVATPQYVDEKVAQSGGGGDDRLSRILAGQSNFIVFEDVDGKMNIVNASLGGYKMAEFGAKVKRVITCGLNGVSGTQSANLFGGNVYQQNPCTNIESIDCIISLPSTCTSAKRTFAQLKLLSSIDVSLFDTSNCTSFMMMFEGTVSLKNLDLTNLNTSKGEDFSSMFNRCFSPRIDMPVEGLDLRNATKVDGMFAEGASGDECPHNRSIGLLNVTGNTAIEEHAAISAYSNSMFGPYFYSSRNKITHLDGLRGLCVSLYLGWCKLLDNESVYNVINEATGGSEDAHIVITFAAEQYNYAISNAEIMAMCEEKFIDIVQG